MTLIPIVLLWSQKCGLGDENWSQNVFSRYGGEAMCPPDGQNSLSDIFSYSKKNKIHPLGEKSDNYSYNNVLTR